MIVRHKKKWCDSTEGGDKHIDRNVILSNIKLHQAFKQTSLTIEFHCEAAQAAQGKFSNLVTCCSSFRTHNCDQAPLNAAIQFEDVER